MSTARSRARTVHGRTPKTSTQLVDEMSTSKDFQSPDIFALRRRQAQVDAAKRGVSRLRRASVRMSDLPRVSTLEAISGSDDSPPRKRADSSGSLFAGSDDDDMYEHDERNRPAVSNRRRSFVSQKAFDLLELELQEKQMELKLAAEIGQMLLEKEQTLSERCASMDVEQTRLKTELNELDNENQILHRKFHAAQKKSKDFQTENLKLSEEIRMLEAESSKLKILADEGEKMRASLNNVNLQLIKLKNENRKLQKKKRDSPHMSMLKSAATLATAENDATLSIKKTSSGPTDLSNANLLDDTIGFDNAEPVVVVGTQAEMGYDIDAENSIVEDGEYKNSSRNNIILTGSSSNGSLEHVDPGGIDGALNDFRNSSLELNRSSTSVDTMFELDHLREENQRLELSETKLSKQVHDLKLLCADSDEKLDQQAIELKVAKTHSEDMHAEVLRLEREARENKEMILSLRDTVEEYKILLNEHDYSSVSAAPISSKDKDTSNVASSAGSEGKNRSDEKMSKPKQALSRSSSIGDDVGYLKSEIEKLKAENERLSRRVTKADTTTSPNAHISSPKPPLVPKVPNQTMQMSSSETGFNFEVGADKVNAKKYIRSSEVKNADDHADDLEKNLQSKIKEIMHMKNELLEKEMAVLRYKKIAIEWRKTMKPTFLVVAQSLKDEGYTLYTITLVHHNGAKHAIQKRYSHFLKFYHELERTLFLTDALIRLPVLPPKVWGRSRSMAEAVVKRRREALKDFLTVMVALTEASGEIAKAFWKFLEFEPPERDAKFLSFHTHSDNERADDD